MSRADFASLAALEWLETNGVGGYAAGTVAGTGTRGYHGLLVAADGNPATRRVIVSGADEWLVLDPPVYLSTHQYPGTVSPDGYRLLEGFSPRPGPTWRYRTPAHRVERRVFMARGQNTTVIRYRLLAGRPVRLAVRLFFVFRDHHARRSESDWRVATTREGEAWRCVPSDGQPEAWVHARGEVRDEPCWYHQFEYLRERERGLPHTEDAYSPFILELPLRRGANTDVVITTSGAFPGRAAALERTEIARRRRLASRGRPADGVSGRLAQAADQFLVATPDGRHSVIAGYPWFADWGRDTLIALPGLARAVGTSAARPAWQALERFAVHRRHGLLPNRFPDNGGEPEYNSVDAGLWLAVAAYRLAAVTGRPVSDSVIDALRETERSYAAGTDFGIHEEEDGLVTAGAPGVALTWMDARVGDWVVTPRRGKPVEVNALWFNLRMVLAELLEARGAVSDADDLRVAAGRTREAFRRAFWDEPSGSLHDLIRPDGSPDRSVRPNQLLAASLPFPLLDRDPARRMLKAVERDLLTPAGLRSLAPGDPAYVGRYGGDQRSRDAAYHQGSVWLWLIGAYADAVRFARGDSAATRRHRRAVLVPLLALLDRGALEQLPEIADGDPPHEPTGCPAQAWSVAEVARVWWETGEKGGRAKREAGKGRRKRKGGKREGERGKGKGERGVMRAEGRAR